MKFTLTKVLWLAGILVITWIAVFAFTSGNETAELQTTTETAELQTTTEVAVPKTLWEIPGFRTSAEGAANDDLLRLWEAFKEEKYIQQCMADEGFVYDIDIAYLVPSLIDPADAATIVGSTGVENDVQKPQAELGTTPTISDSDSLSADELDRYFMTLYGETATDYQYFATTGSLPKNHSGSGFAQGGCFGAAENAVAGVGALRNEINDAVRIEKEKEMLKASACTTPNGVRLEDLEDLELAYMAVYESGENIQDAESDLASCEPLLNNTNDAAWERARAKIFARHNKRLLSHAEYWTAVANEIPKDSEFVQTIKDAVADLEQSWSDVDTNPQSTG
ncbi:MAG: hypothetical protein KTU85_08735 [Acidimicrobiia bacterium]|nr:hypothetical protein [Acidimicrobiia bacterium]MCY4456969.1 hypothetical protein [Acidimicrobiaceae bacterium]